MQAEKNEIIYSGLHDSQMAGKEGERAAPRFLPVMMELNYSSCMSFGFPTCEAPGTHD